MCCISCICSLVNLLLALCYKEHLRESSYKHKYTHKAVNKIIKKIVNIHSVYPFKKDACISLTITLIKYKTKNCVSQWSNNSQISISESITQTIMMEKTFLIPNSNLVLFIKIIEWFLYKQLF